MWLCTFPWEDSANRVCDEERPEGVFFFFKESNVQFSKERNRTKKENKAPPNGAPLAPLLLCSTSTAHALTPSLAQAHGPSSSPRTRSAFQLLHPLLSCSRRGEPFSSRLRPYAYARQHTHRPRWRRQLCGAARGRASRPGVGARFGAPREPPLRQLHPRRPKAFAEEVLPGLDVVPTATIGWLLENTELGRSVNEASAPPPKADAPSSAAGSLGGTTPT